jgi:hypothetical protein
MANRGPNVLDIDPVLIGEGLNGQRSPTSPWH